MWLLAFLLYMVSGTALSITCLIYLRGNKQSTWSKEQQTKREQQQKTCGKTAINDFDDDETTDVLMGIEGIIAYIEKNNYYLSVEEKHYFERIKYTEMNNLIHSYTQLSEVIKEQQKEKFINGLLIIQNQLNEYKRTIDRQMVYQFERNFELVNQQK